MGAPLGNKYAVGANSGRPPIYDNQEDLLKECEAYFEWIKGEKGKFKQQVRNEETGEFEEKEYEDWVRYPENATITGLALYLGFCSRGTLNEYAKKDEFSDIIKRAMSKVEQSYEFRLVANNPTGAIFALKNMGWQDKTQQEFSGPNGGPIPTAQQHVVRFEDMGE